MIYLRLWYYKKGCSREYNRVSFCKWKFYGHNSHYEKNALKWFKFLINNMPRGVTERLYILLRNYYGKNFEMQK